MGPVNYKYLHNEKAGYQYICTTINGLSVLSTDFGVSMEYFGTEVRENGTAKVGEIVKFIKEKLFGSYVLETSTCHVV